LYAESLCLLVEKNECKFWCKARTHRPTRRDETPTRRRRDVDETPTTTDSSWWSSTSRRRKHQLQLSWPKCSAIVFFSNSCRRRIAWNNLMQRDTAAVSSCLLAVKLGLELTETTAHSAQRRQRRKEMQVQPGNVIKQGSKEVEDVINVSYIWKNAIRKHDGFFRGYSAKY